MVANGLITIPPPQPLHPYLLAFVLCGKLSQTVSSGSKGGLRWPVCVYMKASVVGDFLFIVFGGGLGGAKEEEDIFACALM